MSEKITVEDVINVQEYCSNFGVNLPPDDRDFLVEMKAKYKKGVELDVDDILKLKVLNLRMLTTNSHESFEDKLWDEPKKTAQEMLDGMKEDE